MKSSLYTTEDSCSVVKGEVEKTSNEHKKNYENMQIVIRRLFEAILEIKKEIKELGNSWMILKKV